MKVRNANTLILVGALGGVLTVVAAIFATATLNNSPSHTDISGTTAAPPATVVGHKSAQPLAFLDGLDDADYDRFVALIRDRRAHQAIDFITSRTSFRPANTKHANRIAYEVSDLDGAQYFIRYLSGLDPVIAARFSQQTRSPTMLSAVIRTAWDACVQPMITATVRMEPRPDYPETDDLAATLHYGTKQIRTSDLIVAMTHYARLEAQAGRKVLEQSGFNLQNQEDWERLLYRAVESGLAGVEHFAADGAARFPNSGALLKSHHALSGRSNRVAESCYKMVGRVFAGNSR